jgi:hypothetical protein
MNTPPEEKWEMRVLNAARAFPYPPTPDIARTTRTALRPPRRIKLTFLRVAAIIMLAVLASILFVPEIRAGVLEFLRVGAVRIFFSSTETPTYISDTPSPQPVETNIATLEDAARALGVPIRLPTYPADVGLPDTVSLVGGAVPVATLIWYEQGTDDAHLVLQMIGDGVDVVKHGVPNSQQVEVNGDYAVWLDVPHLIEMYDPDGHKIPGMSWLIQSHVLVWAEDGITYRLETTQSLDEALAIAESLQPLDGGEINRETRRVSPCFHD